MTAGALAIAYQQPRGEPGAVGRRHAPPPGRPVGRDRPVRPARRPGRPTARALTIRSRRRLVGRQDRARRGPGDRHPGHRQRARRRDVRRWPRLRDRARDARATATGCSVTRWRPAGSGSAARASSWAERWQSSVAFAVGEKPPAAPPPTPAPRAGDGLRAAARHRRRAAPRRGIRDARPRWMPRSACGSRYLAPAGRSPAASGTRRRGPATALASLAWLLDGCDDQLAVWGRGPVPDPAAAARHARSTRCRPGTRPAGARWCGTRWAGCGSSPRCAWR